MTQRQVRQILLSTNDLETSIRYYSEVLGFPLKFRDGDHYAALDGGTITIALATARDHPIPGEVVLGIKTSDVDADAQATSACGGVSIRTAYDDAHERRAVVRDRSGNGVVFYSPRSK